MRINKEFVIISLWIMPFVRSRNLQNNELKIQRKGVMRKLPKDKSANPTQYPTKLSSVEPSQYPTLLSSPSPSVLSSIPPSENPTKLSSIEPSLTPTFYPSVVPSFFPSGNPSQHPIGEPTSNPSNSPTVLSSTFPTLLPSLHPSANPTLLSSVEPTLAPSTLPTLFISHRPSGMPSEVPTNIPSQSPSLNPTKIPSESPTMAPSDFPSGRPTASPTIDPDKFVFLSASIQTALEFVPNKMSSVQKAMYKDDVQSFLSALFRNTLPPIENVEVLVGNQILIEQVDDMVKDDNTRRRKTRNLQFLEEPLYILQVQILVSGQYIKSDEFSNQEVDMAGYLDSFFTAHGNVLRDFIRGRHVDYFKNVQRIFPIMAIQDKDFDVTEAQGSFFTSNAFQIVLIAICGALLLLIFFLVYAWVRRLSRKASQVERSSILQAARDVGNTIDYLDGKTSEQQSNSKNAVSSQNGRYSTDEDRINSPPRVLHKDVDFNDGINLKTEKESEAQIASPRNQTISKQYRADPTSNYKNNEADYYADPMMRPIPGRNASYAPGQEQPPRNESYDSNPLRQSYDFPPQNQYNSQPSQNDDAASVHSLPVARSHDYRRAQLNLPNIDRRSSPQDDAASVHSVPHVRTRDYHRSNNDDAASVHSAYARSSNYHRSSHGNDNASVHSAVPYVQDYRSQPNIDEMSVQSAPRVQNYDRRPPNGVDLSPHLNPNHYNQATRAVSPTSPNSVRSASGRPYRKVRSIDESAVQTTSIMNPQRNSTNDDDELSPLQSDLRNRNASPTSFHNTRSKNGMSYRTPPSIEETNIQSNSDNQNQDELSPLQPLPRTITPSGYDKRFAHDDISDVTSFRSNDLNSIAVDSLDSIAIAKWNKRECFAPPGKLGLAVRSSTLGPVVTGLHDASPLKGQMYPGDFIVAIDDLDTRGMPADVLTKVSESRKLKERRFTVMSKRNASKT